MALKVENVAAELGVSKQVIYREIKEGNLAAFRVGKQQLRIEEKEVEAYKNRNRVDLMEEL